MVNRRLIQFQKIILSDKLHVWMWNCVLFWIFHQGSKITEGSCFTVVFEPANYCPLQACTCHCAASRQLGFLFCFFLYQEANEKIGSTSLCVCFPPPKENLLISNFIYYCYYINKNNQNGFQTVTHNWALMWKVVAKYFHAAVSFQLHCTQTAVKQNVIIFRFLYFLTYIKKKTLGGSSGLFHFPPNDLLIS